MAAEDESLEIPIAWVGGDEVPIVFVNQFLIQHQPQEFILSIGQMTGPAVVGTLEQQREQAAEINFVPIKTVARIGMTRHRLQELIAVLQANLDRHDETMEEADPR